VAVYLDPPLLQKVLILLDYALGSARPTLFPRAPARNRLASRLRQRSQLRQENRQTGIRQYAAKGKDQALVVLLLFLPL
jgi:hypothetical protein